MSDIFDISDSDLDQPNQSDAKATDTEDYFLSDGTLHRGPVSENAKGVKFGDVTETCPKCNGSGRWKRRHACLKCEGEGELYDQRRLYTQKEVEAKERGRVRAAEKIKEKQRTREADIAERHQAFIVEHKDLWERALGSENPFVQKLISASETWGGLTEKQHAALIDALDRADAEKAQFANSTPVGEIGERLSIEVVCTSVWSFMSKKFKGRGMQEVFGTEMIDPDGRAFYAMTASFNLEKGERVMLVGTVKGHDDRRGWARTRLNRVRVLDHLPALSPEEERQSPVAQVDVEYDLAASAPTM